MRTIIVRALAFLLVAHVSTRADELLYRYEGDALPQDVGWANAQNCEPPCHESTENGHLVVRWPTLGGYINYTYFIAQSPQLPPAPPFWVEWSFKSNHPFTQFHHLCDASFRIRYNTVFDGLQLNGNAVFPLHGGPELLDLELDTLRTFRFETPDGGHYTIYVDGKPLFEDDDYLAFQIDHWVQIEGQGGCTWDNIPNKINEWDFVRYGQISYGEQIVSTSPPNGELDATQYPALDRFTVTFDAPNYVFVDDISVEVLGLPGTPVPMVLASKRLDNSEPEIVEIILDRPMPIGATTRFTLNDGTTVNTVEFTLPTPGACCAGITCVDSIEPACNALLIPHAVCTTPQLCCQPSGSCAVLDPVCCAASGGVATDGMGPCAGDADGDGVDAQCGDKCPDDAAKIEPGVCGCGLSDTADSDNDTTQDCLDQCPGADDRIFAPGCVAAIPTASQWGVLITALGLLCVAKVAFGRRDISLSN